MSFLDSLSQQLNRDIMTIPYLSFYLMSFQILLSKQLNRDMIIPYLSCYIMSFLFTLQAVKQRYNDNPLPVMLPHAISRIHSPNKHYKSCIVGDASAAGWGGGGIILIFTVHVDRTNYISTPTFGDALCVLITTAWKVRRIRSVALNHKVLCA